MASYVFFFISRKGKVNGSLFFIFLGENFLFYLCVEIEIEIEIEKEKPMSEIAQEDKKV